ncbi:MAG: molybdopterin-dependent oxidoreductase [Chromatiales bacterium]|nr:molybdopterin-dependent oxidoreductase [Chromatiales bacterium]
MTLPRTDRREFLKAGGAAAALGLSLKYTGAAAMAAGGDPGYVAWEDIMRQKWTWDRVVRGSRGINCTGHCAFNVYVKNGVVWREEQQGEYGRSGEDTPDYGPRGCQKGVRHSKYMYGRQRVLYPMKRIGERGEGKWERISWEQAIDEVTDRMIEHVTESGPNSVTFAMGTQMILKRASLTAMFRFANVTGIVVPETFAGVGDLPVGAYMTLGHELPGDNMAAVYKSKCCLIWFCNPAATRIPDAHFFWEARYNGTDVVTICPDFNASAMHSSRWVNPNPGTDTALAMAMVQTIIADREHIEWDYVREQTDLPFLIRLDNRKYLRGSDLGEGDDRADATFYFWDEEQQRPVKAPATDAAVIPGAPPPPAMSESLFLNGIRPAVEGRWTVRTANGEEVEVTTVFELVKELCERDYTPEKVQAVTGVHPDVTRDVARSFAASGAGMIYAGYRSCKWLHGDKLQRAWLLMCGLTGNTGRAGGGMQTTQLSKADGIMQFVTEGIGPRLKIAAISIWDYAHGDGKELNTQAYGEETANYIDDHYRESIRNGWLPDYSTTPWKMAFMCGHNTANWRASGTRFRDTVMARLETIVAMTPHMSVTAMYSDYVLPVADHYEREDMVMEGRTPYVQVLDKAVPPIGDSRDDWTIMGMMAKALSEKAVERQLPPVPDVIFGNPVQHDYSQAHRLFTYDGRVNGSRDLVEFLLARSFGLPRISFDEFASRGFVRVDDSDDVQFGPNSPYSYQILASVRDRKPYQTLTGRQQFYMDHDWFIKEGEELPVHVDPLVTGRYKMRLTMGHARHSIHSMYRDDTLLLSLQRGEPDVFVNPDDARERGVADGDIIRVYNHTGAFIAMAHVTPVVGRDTLFMYHGWDPMQFRGRQNFSGAIPTAGLLKPTSLIGNYGHIFYRTPNYVPNQTYHDFTCDFEKYEERKTA